MSYVWLGYLFYFDTSVNCYMVCSYGLFGSFLFARHVLAALFLSVKCVSLIDILLNNKNIILLNFAEYRLIIVFRGNRL